MKDLYSFNDGYAFVTFSYSDEARIAMLFSNYIMVGNNFVDVHLKNDLDHGDFDIDYVKGWMKADAKILEIQDDLVKAKNNLQDF